MPAANIGATDPRVFPSEARAGQRDYSGQLVVRFACSVNGEAVANMDRNLGEVPVMVKVSPTTSYPIHSRGRGRPDVIDIKALV